MPTSLIAFADTPPLAGDHPLVARYLQHMPLLNLYRAAELPAQAERIAEQLARTPEGRRAVSPFYILAFELKASEYPVDAIGIFERGHIDVTRDTRGMAELAWRLQRRGVVLDYIFCDNENSLTPWDLGQERFIEIYASDTARARMPEHLRRFDPATLKFPSPEYHEWMRALVPYSDEIRMGALRKSLCDSGLLSPWAGSPGHPGTVAVNFLNLRTSFRCYDFNGWEYESQALVDHRTSAPVFYPTNHGARYKGRAHHPYWNCFVDGLNFTRSAAATSDVVPVIREPLRARGQPVDTVDPGARWYTEQFMAHMVRTGARRFTYFRPHAWAADDIAIAEILDRHDHAPIPTTPLATPLPEIPLDVDEVVTGDFRTTYSDFLAQEPERWVTPA